MTAGSSEDWLERIARQLLTMPEAAKDRALQLLASRGLSLADLPILPGTRPEKVPLSHAQQRQWVLWELDHNSTAYNLVTAVRLRGPLDRESLVRSFEALARRHESLRTRIVSEDGIAYQVIDEPAPVTMVWDDLSRAPESKRTELAAQQVRAEARSRFDLDRGPLLQVKVLKLAENEHIVSLVQHHIVSDGWSMRVLVEELVELYGAYTAGRQPHLEELPLQYADYAVWQRKWLDTGELKRQLAYWKGHLGDTHPVLELPWDYPRPTVGHARSARHGFEVSEESVKGLRRVGECHQATLFMMLLAAWKVLLYRYTGQGDLRVGVPHSNRSRPELEGLIGLFINTHVLRTRLSGDDSFLDVLSRVREASQGAQAHQDLPFERLVEALNPKRSLSQSPLFQVSHDHQRGRGGELTQLRDLTVERFPSERETTPFDLILYTTEVGERLIGALTYSADRFKVATAQRMVGHYCRLLQHIVEAPEQRIARISLIGESEREILLHEWASDRNVGRDVNDRQTSEAQGNARVNEARDRKERIYREVPIRSRTIKKGLTARN